MLVTGDAANRDCVAEQGGADFAEVRGTGLNCWHQVGGNVQGGQQLVVPLIGAHIEQHGARGIADIGGVHSAFGELPDQPAVHGAKGQFTVGSQRTRAGHVVQNPFQLGAGEIGVHQQSRFGPDGVGQTPCAQLGAGGFGTPVLPDDGVVNGLTGLAVPHQGGFALVGNAQCGDLLRGDAGLCQCLARRGQLQSPDFQRVVFHPARLGIDLRQFLLRHGHGLAIGGEDDAAATGGALVQGEQVGHGCLLINGMKGIAEPVNRP